MAKENKSYDVTQFEFPTVTADDCIICLACVFFFPSTLDSFLF